MNIFKTLILPIVAISAISINAIAQNNSAENGEYGINIFKKLDLDGDKKITLDELHRFNDEKMSQIDHNEDGFISLKEAIISGKTKETFEVIDADKSGLIDRSEHDSADDKRFLEADQNGDKEVTWQEYMDHYKEVNK
ncbi:hypothetical protein N9W34_02110 [Rickettsiales bacterium]|nr:hypothetical protein [Rickettsiales bacterium]